MVQNCYNIKEWLQQYTISMKHHTSFRTFKFVLEVNNAVLYYKIHSIVYVFFLFLQDTSFDENWKRVSDEMKDGIILFESYPQIIECSQVLVLQELDLKLIQTFMNAPSITFFLMKMTNYTICIYWQILLFSLLNHQCNSFLL